MNIKCNRVMALVRRDMVESTPVIIFGHEYAILQAIHGEDSVSLVTDPDRVISQSTEGLTKEQRSEQIEKMLAPQELESQDEYMRLVDRYGMHPEVSVPNVEYVHGRANSQTWLDAMSRDVEDTAEEVPAAIVKRKYTRRETSATA